MKHRGILSNLALLSVIIILLGSNLICFQLPVGGTDTDSRTNFETEIHILDTIYTPKLNPESSQAHSESIETTGNTCSVRDQNNNKVSDQLERWVAEGYTKLDLVVVYDHEITDDDIEKLIAQGMKITNVYRFFNMVALHDVSPGSFTKLTALPGVFRLENHGTPVLYSDVATPAIKARESTEYSPLTAWELGYTGNGANIAVVDTGADNEHPALAGKWVGGADISKPETILTPRDGTYDADDTNGHGTTCSGIAMGTGAPDGVYMGAAPDAKLVDVRIGTLIGYAPGELLQSYYDASLEGIHWSVEHKDDSWPGEGDENKGIDIISLSWGIDVGGNSDGSDLYSQALDRAVDSGIIVSHAAGNSGPNNVGFDGFAAASNGISVASSDDLNTIDRSDDIIAEYSSRGPRRDNNDGNPYNELKPDITAPGTHIMQAQFDIVGDGSGNGYGNRGSGTSYAAPVVAGVCAMMLEANPDLTPELVKEILHLTAERRGEASEPDLDPFWNRDFGWGVVDAYKAVKLASEITSVGAYDVNLQCFITGIDVPGPTQENITSGTITVHGLAYARDGEIDNIEFQVDDDSWRRIRKTSENGSYILWEYEVDTFSLKNGNHTLKARANGAGGQSLEHSVEIEVINRQKPGEDFTTSSFTTAIGVVVIIGVAVIIYFYYRKMTGAQK